MQQLIDMLDQHISKHKDYANKFDTGAMVARNFAMALLEKEENQMIDIYCQGCLDMHSNEDIFPRETGRVHFKNRYKSNR